ncbi:MAG TPA: phosphatidate cytidylyltransferase, partial [Actinomycetota bacterium]|nr:phosphatidate cytidylyltransferase [Actinomycetota bacterium]
REERPEEREEPPTGEASPGPGPRTEPLDEPMAPEEPPTEAEPPPRTEERAPWQEPPRAGEREEGPPPPEEVRPEVEEPWEPAPVEADEPEEEEPSVRGLDEPPAVPEPEEPPTDEDLEAAAEHFAASLRVEEERAEGAEEEPPTPGRVEQEILADLEQPPAPRTVQVGREGLGGPSWQEPTAVEVGLEGEARPPGRDVPAAFLTGLVLAALAIGSLAVSKTAFAAVAGVLVLVAQGELYAVMHRRHLHPATAVGLITGGLVLAAGYAKGEAAMLAMLGLGTIAVYLWYMAAPASARRDVTTSVGLTMFPVVYVALLAGYALTTLALPTPPDGRALLLAVLGLTFVYDTAAFVVGYFWGSRPLAPTVSPKKSWEGAIGATLVVIAVSVGIVASAVPALEPVGRSVGLGIVVALFAPLGDLAESLLKRDLGVKDMGSILPGHGGVLDRIDSVLFVAPAALVFFRLVLT